VLRFQEGLSVAEAAAILDLPEATVRTHTARGLRELREALGDNSHHGKVDRNANTRTPPRPGGGGGGGGDKASRKEGALTRTD
jgi:hypothetical protein